MTCRQIQMCVMPSIAHLPVSWAGSPEMAVVSVTLQCMLVSLSLHWRLISGCGCTVGSCNDFPFWFTIRCRTKPLNTCCLRILAKERSSDYCMLPSIHNLYTNTYAKQWSIMVSLWVLTHSVWGHAQIWNGISAKQNIVWFDALFESEFERSFSLHIKFRLHIRL